MQSPWLLLLLLNEARIECIKPRKGGKKQHKRAKSKEYRDEISLDAIRYKDYKFRYKIESRFSIIENLKVFAIALLCFTLFSFATVRIWNKDDLIVSLLFALFLILSFCR